MVSDPLAESGHQPDKTQFFLAERVFEVSVIHYLEEMWICGADSSYTTRKCGYRYEYL